MMPNRTLVALGALLLAGVAVAGEGKWTPQQILELDPKWLRAQGLKLPPDKLWDPKEGTGLLAATVNLSGCSAAFISETGLIVTNHHCLFGIIQQHATPQRDLIKQGFLARKPEDELPGKAERIYVPRRFTDVTKDVLAAVPEGADDLARYKAIQKKQTQLIAECEKRPATRCQVEAYDDGLFFLLIDSLEIADVRLVYAPPRAVGEYGGEIDNWSWPRHTGDFAIGRAYVAPDGGARTYDPANVPFKSRFFFPLSEEGVQPGDFVAVMGFPGYTFRSLVAEEMAEREGLFYPRVIDVYGEWIRLLEDVKDEQGRILVAATLKSLHNRHKNGQGQLAGFKRGRILDKQRKSEEAVAAWAQGKPKSQAALQARQGLVELVADRKKTWERDFLFSTISPESAGVPKALWLSATATRLSLERQKPDPDREPWFQNRELRKLKDRFEREQKSFYAPADKKIVASFVRRALALPEGQRISAIDRVFGTGADAAAIDAKLEQLYAGSRVLDPAERAKMFEESTEQLKARKDPLLDLGFELATQMRQATEESDRRKGAVYRLRPEWRRAVIAHAGKPVAPDANRTLRVSLAKVVGYVPRDGVWYTPQTTLQGLLAKDTGQEPFDVPRKLRQAYEQGRFGRWKDKKLGDVPVDFLADADTTGGNSGSPVIDGQGRLVGVNFDRVWENVANDFGYNPDVARNINADVRYLLWHLDQVEDAAELLNELKIRRK